ncbi:MAG: hypothetical protein JWO87_1689 [Phycisphaerales bacterium]|nr:hypothetical protein [Phycisphaerales bacterium]
MLRAIRPVALAAALMLASCNEPFTSHSNGEEDDNQPPPPPPGQNDPPPPPPPNPAPGTDGTPGSVIGAYRIEVGGFYVGHGTGSVGSGSATVDAQVKDDAGQVGAFHAHLTLAHGHFRGTGTVMGYTLTCEGRVDPADAKANKAAVLIKPRLVGTFTASNGHHGRIIGQYDPSAQN